MDVGGSYFALFVFEADLENNHHDIQPLGLLSTCGGGERLTIGGGAIGWVHH